MIDLAFFGLGFMFGCALMGICIMAIDNREWVRNLKKKNALRDSHINKKFKDN